MQSILKSENSFSIFIPSTLVSVSGVGAVFASVPSFATTKARVPLSHIEATGPLHTSKEAILGEVVWWKSEVEDSLIWGCEAAMFTVNPKLMVWWSLTGNTNGRFVRLFAFSFAECLLLTCIIFFPSSESLFIGSALYLTTVSQPTIDPSALIISLSLRFSLAVKPSQRSLALLTSSLFFADRRFWTICKTCWLDHGTIIRTGITCKKISCYMRDSTWRWFIVKKAKIFMLC